MPSSKKSLVREALACNVSKYRKSKLTEKGKPWTQSRLAEECGVSLGTVQKIEAGVSWPDWNTVLKISKALDVDVDSFYIKHDNMNLSEALGIVNRSLGINLQPLNPKLHMDEEFFLSTLKHELEAVKKTIPPQVHKALHGLVDKIVEAVG